MSALPGSTSASKRMRPQWQAPSIFMVELLGIPRQAASYSTSLRRPKVRRLANMAEINHASLARGPPRAHVHDGSCQMIAREPSRCSPTVGGARRRRACLAADRLELRHGSPHVSGAVATPSPDP